MAEGYSTYGLCRRGSNFACTNNFHRTLRESAFGFSLGKRVEAHGGCEVSAGTCVTCS